MNRSITRAAVRIVLGSGIYNHGLIFTMVFTHQRYQRDEEKA